MNTSDDEYSSSQSAGRPSPGFSSPGSTPRESPDSIYKSSVDDLECELAEYKEDKQPYDQLAAPAPPAPRAYWSTPPPPIPEFNDDPMTWGYNDVRPGWE